MISFKSYGLILIVLGRLPGLPAMAGDFREPRWGMSRRLVEQVKRIEEQSQLPDHAADGDQLTYRGSILGFDAVVRYDFRDDKLYGVRWLIEESRRAPGAYMKDYDTLKQALRKKYGTPAIDHPLETEGERTAMVFGYFTAWLTDRSKVYLILYDKGGETRILLGQMDRQYLPESTEELVDLYSVLE